MRVETIAEQLFFVTCRIKALIGGSLSVGTGFIYTVPTVQGDAAFIVTNRHVVEGASEISVTFVNAPPVTAGEHVTLGRGFEVTVEDFQGTAHRFHPNPSIDIAVIPLAAFVEVMLKGGNNLFYRSASPALAQGVGADVELDAIEDLVFIGYPSGLYDPAHFLPVLRKGTSASPIEIDHAGEPKFLIDASVVPGSSGSPVFIFNKGSYPTRDGNVSLSSRISLVGIVASTNLMSDFAELKEQNTSLGVEVRSYIGIGIVYKARAIDEVVQIMLDGSGLTRLTSEEPVVSASADEATPKV